MVSARVRVERTGEVKADLEAFSLQLLQEGSILGIGAGFAAGVGFVAQVERPDTNGGAESQVGEERVHQLRGPKRLAVGIVKDREGEATTFGPGGSNVRFHWAWD